MFSMVFVHFYCAIVVSSDKTPLKSPSNCEEYSSAVSFCYSEELKKDPSEEIECCQMSQSCLLKRLGHKCYLKEVKGHQVIESCQPKRLKRKLCFTYLASHITELMDCGKQYNAVIESCSRKSDITAIKQFGVPLDTRIWDKDVDHLNYVCCAMDALANCTEESSKSSFMFFPCRQFGDQRSFYSGSCFPMKQMKLNFTSDLCRKTFETYQPPSDASVALKINVCLIITHLLSLLFYLSTF